LEIVNLAEASQLESPLAHSYVNLAQIYSFMGEVELATQYIGRAAPLLKKLGYRTALAKLRWGVAHLLRGQGRVVAAIDAFRTVECEFSELGMWADAAAVQLVIADLFLGAGQEKQAEREIRQVLPIIDEYRLVPEGFAAMTLLRE